MTLSIGCSIVYDHEQKQVTWTVQLPFGVVNLYQKPEDFLRNATDVMAGLQKIMDHVAAKIAGSSEQKVDFDISKWEKMTEGMDLGLDPPAEA